MANSKTNKVVIITGGAKRIGKAIALLLHQQQYDLVIHFHSSAQQAKQLAEQLNQTRANSCLLVQGELAQENNCQKIIAAASNHFGRVDAVINNASNFYPTPIELATEEQWQDLMASNLKAPIFITKYAAPELRKHQGCIINIIDIYAQRPLAEHPIYCAAKAGLQSLTKSLAADLAPEIRVNGVAPGAILWPENDSGVPNQQELLKRVPLGRLGEPDDIAKAVKFLIADAPYISGQIIAVDGGRSVKP